MRALWPFVAVAVLVSALALSGLTARLGAHPWWAGQVVWIGGGAGLALAAMLAWAGQARGRWISLLLLLGLGALALAAYGKARFAASYAEDALAGQFWYFGWIAGMAGLAGCLALGVVRLSRASVGADRR